MNTATKKARIRLLVCGLIIGVISALLVLFGNPKNMGFCIACFIRDTAGALGLHRAAAVQYIRPEIIGLVLGAFGIACLKKEFLPRGGSSPLTRFVLGFFVMTSALVFLGCPFRMVLRMAGGDLNAWIAVVGFACGIGVGVLFLKKGYSLKRTYTLPTIEGAWLPIIQVVLFVLLLAAPAFIFFSESGPGSMRAPVAIALVAGLVVGALAQRTRLCMVGGFRDLYLFKDGTLILGFLGILAAAAITNIAVPGLTFKLSITGQPVAHIDGVWNFLSMLAVGFGGALLGGCPLRQLILAGEGNTDSAVTVLGLLVGAAFSHNFGLASSATTITDGVVSGGPTANGKIAVIAALVVMLIIAFVNTKPAKAAADK